LLGSSSRVPFCLCSTTHGFALSHTLALALSCSGFPFITTSLSDDMSLLMPSKSIAQLSRPSTCFVPKLDCSLWRSPFGIHVTPDTCILFRQVGYPQGYPSKYNTFLNHFAQNYGHFHHIEIQNTGNDESKPWMNKYRGNVTPKV
jgi:hypothetical protein